MYVMVALTYVFYALWAASHEDGRVLWTVPLFMAIGMRYSLDIEGDSEGDPIEVIFKDIDLFILVGFYIGVMMYIVYYDVF